MKALALQIDCNTNKKDSIEINAVIDYIDRIWQVARDMLFDP